MEKQTQGLRVGVLMSGGVDSSVAAHLLLRDGYVVSGVFITIRNPSHVPCTAAADKQDAMRACAALGIPFIEYDATDVYRSKVIEPFVGAYRRGETPNPDVLCNQFIKFDVLYDFLKKKGFDRVATGHYAQVRVVDGVSRLHRSADERKDQTYFIYAISQRVLNHVLFPVGEYVKSQVRSLAVAANLPAAHKKDSVGLCFLGDVSMKDFLSVYIEPKVGEVRVLDGGEAIGVHDGAWFYTVGQRHGFSVTSADRGPYVIVEKDIVRNVLFVRKGGDDAGGGCGGKKFHLANTVFRRIPGQDESVLARYRHRGGLYPVACSVDDNSAEVAFTELHTIAVGQSLVLYGGDGECFGGGSVCGG